MAAPLNLRILISNCNHFVNIHKKQLTFFVLHDTMPNTSTGKQSPLDELLTISYNYEVFNAYGMGANPWLFNYGVRFAWWFEFEFIRCSNPPADMNTCFFIPFALNKAAFLSPSHIYINSDNFEERKEWNTHETHLHLFYWERRQQQIHKKSPLDLVNTLYCIQPLGTL